MSESHDYFYHRDDWETTYPDDMEQEAFADFGAGVYRMGRLKELTDQYVAVVWIDGAQEVTWFETAEEAKAFVEKSHE